MTSFLLFFLGCGANSQQNQEAIFERRRFGQKPGQTGGWIAADPGSAEGSSRHQSPVL